MSADISQVFERAAKAGISFALDSEGGLLVEADQPLTEAQRAWILGHKSALFGALAGKNPPTVGGKILAWLVSQPGRRGEFDAMCAALGWATLEARTAAALAVTAAAERGVIEVRQEKIPEAPYFREWLRAYPWPEYDAPATREKNHLDGMGNGLRKGRSKRNL